MEVSPILSADLAEGVYSVNKNDPVALKIFLSASAFSQKVKPSVLTASVGGRLLRAAKDGFGICAQGGGDYQGHAFLIFRGTTEANNRADFVTDARIGITISKTGLPVHIGFNHTFNSMLPDIRDFLAGANIAGPVHCIGHSLGGAVASLAADWISKNTSHPVRLYTFGAPRVGTDWFVNRTTVSIGRENMYRVYHKTDPVPMLAMYPFMQAPYGSSGYFIHSSELALTGAAHKMGKYIASVKNKSWEQVGDVPDQPYLIESAVEDWLKSKSWVSADSPAFWHWAEAALRYVLKKLIMSVAYSLQTTFVGVLTVADKLAIILEKGLHLAEHISLWVELLIRKLLHAFGMKVEASREAITRSLIRMVLVRLMEKANRQARNALRNL
ncbi:lipase family protein [Microbulbifer pacificus]|uniref:lipase family protein n=1 Tax=Microbulbifer pacificus TaxID=407164 RepID=UPI000CF39BD2|nr:lipase family protein [Microbulbifer pacificus]